eukprot:TRINITY_DN28503_c0_g1_i1.p1 TRINITY_DN28503_c0_g1~~TRINITY_DN28503_c0_g1_i1.p1  ORF type:complete len:1026 (+),score=146.08 TRINITY_DN28503_c0_g1_i1:22-3078(+)
MALPDEILCCLSRHQQELLAILRDWKSRVESQHAHEVAVALAQIPVAEERSSQMSRKVAQEEELLREALSSLPLPMPSKPMYRLPLAQEKELEKEAAPSLAMRMLKEPTKKFPLTREEELLKEALSSLPLPLLAEPRKTLPLPAQEFEEQSEEEPQERCRQDDAVVTKPSMIKRPGEEEMKDLTWEVDEVHQGEEEEGEDLAESTERWRHLYTKLMATLNGEQPVYVHDRWSQERKDGLKDGHASGNQDLDDFAAVMLREVLEEKQHQIFDPRSYEVGPRRSLAQCRIPRLHPNSPKRLAWIFLALLMCCVEFVVVPIEIAHTLPETTAYIILSWTGLFFWSADIIVNFLTGVFVHDTVHMDLPTIAKDYITSWFPLDITIVSLEWLSSMVGMDASAVSIFRVLRVLRLAKLLRIGKLYKIIQDVMLHKLSYFGDLVVVWKLCMLYVGGLHLIGCFWFWARQSSDLSYDFMSTLGIEPHDVYSAYVLSLEWALGFLVGIPPDLRVNSSIEVTTAFLLQFLGSLAFAFLVARLVVLAQVLVNHDESELHAACSSYLMSRSISPMLAKITTKSLDIHHAGHRMSQKLAREENFLGKLPRYLQINLREEAFAHILSHRHFFQEFRTLHHTAFRHLCFEALTEHVVKKGDVVFNSGQVAASMKFVRTGHFSYTLSGLSHTRQSAKTFMMTLASSLRAEEGEGTTEGNTHAQAGDALSEAVLWMPWFHTGKLQATAYSLLLDLSADKFGEVISNYKKPFKTAVGYAHKFVNQQQKNPGVCTDFSSFMLGFNDLDDWLPSEADLGDHFVFLSHFKTEAGTEAVLMKEAMTKFIKQDRAHFACRFRDPVFLDSDNLVDLTKLTGHLLKTHNLVLLLTPNVLERPWCLVEIVAAVRQGINVVPVEIVRPGLRYVYPTEDFFREFRTGRFLTQADHDVLLSNSVSLVDAEKAIRHVFTKIAISFSPHRSQDIRIAEIMRIMQRCTPRQTLPATTSRQDSLVNSESQALAPERDSAVKKPKGRVSSFF